jgi:hypothetical protein
MHTFTHTDKYLKWAFGLHFPHGVIFLLISSLFLGNSYIYIIDMKGGLVIAAYFFTLRKLSTIEATFLIFPNAFNI